MDPGPTPWKNSQFMVFLAAVLRAVHKYGVPLRIGVTGAGNDHRLGANEAPPAILSVFVGEQLEDVIKAFSEGKSDAETWRGGAMTPGVSALAPLARDITDRNRTSPFAFTGNKFEFRAVGSSQSIALPNITLNASVACALDDIATELEKVGNGDPDKAARTVLTKFFEEHLPIIFNGNNYTKEWEEDAEKRGLPNYKDSVTALTYYTHPEVKEVFSRHGILNERELEARQEVLLENYVKVVHVETKLVQSMGRSTILPVALKALAQAATLINLPKPASATVNPGEAHYNSLYEHASKLTELLDKLDATHIKLDAIEEYMDKAKAARDELIPLLSHIRTHVDALELLVDDSEWPLPKYGELLWQ
jgi:glutamine synthetase